MLVASANDVLVPSPTGPSGKYRQLIMYQYVNCDF